MEAIVNPYELVLNQLSDKSRPSDVPPVRIEQLGDINEIRKKLLSTKACQWGTRPLQVQGGSR